MTTPTTDRYRVPDPLCHHARRGIVTAGGGPAEAHASTQVCDRDGCIADAMQWATAVTRLPAEHRPDQERPPVPSLFDTLEAQGG